jgi:hypothetical protein
MPSIETKLLEIRDHHTLIPALATRIDPDRFDANERYLFGRVGFSGDNYVLLTNLDPVTTQYDSFSWGSARTMGNAHRFIKAHWDELKNGDVVDVEFILGETTEPKRNELVS